MRKEIRKGYFVFSGVTLIMLFIRTVFISWPVAVHHVLTFKSSLDILVERNMSVKTVVYRKAAYTQSATL